MAGKLIIARHHESEWNKLGKWTGLHDCHLDEYGVEKSLDMGHLIEDISIDQAFTSMLARTVETCTCIMNICKHSKTPVEHSEALNERDYGNYTGKNKWEMKELLGEEEFTRMRRTWNYPIPNGETLKEVYDRVVPYFLNSILPKVNNNESILVVAHGNSLRALIKYIEQISDEDIAHVEITFGQILIYNLDQDGHMTHKEERHTKSEVPA